jgi:hypothetical protein
MPDTVTAADRLRFARDKLPQSRQGSAPVSGRPADRQTRPGPPRSPGGAMIGILRRKTDVLRWPVSSSRPSRTEAERERLLRFPQEADRRASDVSAAQAVKTLAHELVPTRFCRVTSQRYRPSIHKAPQRPRQQRPKGSNSGLRIGTRE